MDYLIYVFNLLLLLFWIRLWSAPAKEFYFNPFLSGTVKFTDSVLAFLRPVLNMPEQAAALVVMLFVILFRCSSRRMRISPRMSSSSLYWGFVDLWRSMT